MVLKYNPRPEFKAKACSLGGLQNGGSGAPLWTALTALGASGSGRLRRLSGALGGSGRLSGASGQLWRLWDACDGSGRLAGACGRLSGPEEYGRSSQK